MLEKPRLSAVKLKNISKQEVSYLSSCFGLYLKRNQNFQQILFPVLLIWDYTLICVKMKVIALLLQKLGFF